MVGIRSQWRALPWRDDAGPNRSFTSWGAARLSQFTSESADARSAAHEGVRNNENVDNRLTQRLQDVNKLALVEATELHYKAGTFRLESMQKKVSDDVN